MREPQKTPVAIELGTLQPKQKEAYFSVANEILYGGAAGGGKSHLMRIASIIWCIEVPGLMVYLFRRLSDDLEKNHVEGPSGYATLLNPWIQSGLVKYNQQKKSFTFWNGSKIFLCHCQHEKDVKKYQGPEIHVLMIDELTHFSDSIYTFLRNRVRMTGVEVPSKYYYECDICDGTGTVDSDSEYVLDENNNSCVGCSGTGRACSFPRIMCGTNPGSEGHNWVKKTFVDFNTPLEPKRASVEGGGMYRQYIPAKLTDNEALMKSDPGYKNKIKGMSNNPAIVKAMLEGSWDIVSGGAFDDVWDRDVHVIKPMSINLDWKVDRAFDWGSTHPFSTLFIAEANGEPSEYLDGSGSFCPPAGSLIVFNEYYGADEKGKGLKMSSKDVAVEIKSREKIILTSGQYMGVVKPGPADNQIHNTTEKGVPTLAKSMASKGIKWTLSNKSAGSRKAGLQLIRDMLDAALKKDGEPGLYFTNNCVNIISHLPVLERDKRDPEDVDTTGDDHDYDALRYRVLAKAKLFVKSKKMKA